MLIGLAEPLKRALNVPICCTLQGEISSSTALASRIDRRRSISFVTLPSTSTRFYQSAATTLIMPRCLGVPQSKMRVAPLGINVGTPRRHDRSDVFTVGFSQVAPEKGLHLLADGYRRFRARSSMNKARLTVAGYLAPEHAAYLDGVRQQLDAAGLGSEFEYRGELDRAGKIDFLQSLDVMSVPASYDEPKGMFLLEAMAVGVPVVQPRRGAFPEILETTGGGILVDRDDPDALAEGLERLQKDRALAASLGRPPPGVRAHYTAGHMAETVSRFTARRSIVNRPRRLARSIVTETATCSPRRTSSSHIRRRAAHAILNGISLTLNR